MRVLQFIVIAIFLAVVMTGCDNDGSMSSSMGFSHSPEKQNNSYVMEDGPNQDKREDNRVKTLKQNLHIVENQLALLNSKLQTEDLQLDKNAIEISEQLRKDLVRLQIDLEKLINSESPRYKESAYRLEKIEDEISQISEEIEDWIEINFEY